MGVSSAAYHWSISLLENTLRVRALRNFGLQDQIRKAEGCSCLKLGTPKVENRTRFHNFWMADIVNRYCIVVATEATAFNRKEIGLRWYSDGETLNGQLFRV